MIKGDSDKKQKPTQAEKDNFQSQISDLKKSHKFEIELLKTKLEKDFTKNLEDEKLELQTLLDEYQSKGRKMQVKN